MITYPSEVGRTSRSTATNGVGFTEIQLDQDGDGLYTLIQLPPDFVQGGRFPVALLQHGANGNSNHINGARMAPTRDALIEAGYVIASRSVGNSYGNDASQAAVVAVVSWIRANLGTPSDVLFHGFSMSGLLGSLLQANKSIPELRGCFFVDGALNLKDQAKNEATKLNIYAAYGVASDGSDFDQKTAGHSPVDRPTADYAGAWVSLSSSPDDTNVVAQFNADLFATNFGSVTTSMPQVKTTGRHVDPTHFVPADCVNFFAAARASIVRVGVVDSYARGKLSSATAEVYLGTSGTWVPAVTS